MANQIECLTQATDRLHEQRLVARSVVPLKAARTATSTDIAGGTDRWAGGTAARWNPPKSLRCMLFVHFDSLTQWMMTQCYKNLSFAKLLYHLNFHAWFSDDTAPYIYLML
jgi:hypothetical protein